MFELGKLPFELNALEPVISARTMELHFHKHHQAYVDNLNKLLPGSGLEGLTLEEIIRQTAGQADRQAIFNNAGQHFNHRFFWDSLRTAEANSDPSGHLLAEIEARFGSLADFKEAFKKTAGGLFGSGWVWLVKKDGRLEIQPLYNADNPVAHGWQPVFGLDVWEHSYYLDYQNRRLDFCGSRFRQDS